MAGQNCEHIRVEYCGNILMVNFDDRKILETRVIDGIKEDLLSLADKQKQVRILLNFQNVEYFSTDALVILIALRRKVSEMDGKLALCCINKDVFRIFETSKFNKVLDIFKDEQSALQCLQ